jgi:hypothetical protein
VEALIRTLGGQISKVAPFDWTVNIDDRINRHSASNLLRSWQQYQLLMLHAPRDAYRANASIDNGLTRSTSNRLKKSLSKV